MKDCFILHCFILSTLHALNYLLILFCSVSICGRLPSRSKVTITVTGVAFDRYRNKKHTNRLK